MKVSSREEALAKELYEIDLNNHQAEDTAWEDQLELIQDTYRRQAMKVVNTKWFKQQLSNANAWGEWGHSLD